MSEFGENIKLYVEKCIDATLTHPGIEAEISKCLNDMGIEPNLETILSYITGTMFGSAIGLWAFCNKVDEGFVDVANERSSERSFVDIVSERSSEKSSIFIQEVSELLARRTMELRLCLSLESELEPAR